MAEINVNYGCGLSVAEGWLNFDASPTLRLSTLPVLGHLAKRKTNFPKEAKFGDVTKRLPVEDCAAVRVYCSHVLEHLSYDDCLNALRETYRIMKPGAVFRGVMPDLAFEVRRYSALSNDPKAAHSFMEATGLGQRKRPRGLGGLATSILGNSQHLWLWDYPALQRTLAECGFSSVRRAEFGDHNDSAFTAAEDAGRWQDCLGWNCIKP